MGNVQKITIRSTFTVFELIFVAAFIIIGHHIVEVHGVITSLDVPLYIQHGETTTMQCTFDDSISDLRNFEWSSSFKNTTDGSEADQLLVYNVITKVWSGPETARMEANLDESGFFSTLTIKEVDYKLDDKRYWCIMQVVSGSTDANGDTEVTVLDKSKADHLLWLDEEVDPELALGVGVYAFQCRVIGAKPAPTIVWTLGGDVEGETIREPNADPRLTDSISTLSVKIDDDFGLIGTEKTLSCKATVPEDTVGVSDTVNITRIGESGCVGDDCPGTGLPQPAIIGISVGVGILSLILIVSAVLYMTHTSTCNGTPDSNQAEAGDSPMTNTPANANSETPKQPAKKAEMK